MSDYLDSLSDKQLAYRRNQALFLLAETFDKIFALNGHEGFDLEQASVNIKDGLDNVAQSISELAKAKREK